MTRSAHDAASELLNVGGLKTVHRFLNEGGERAVSCLSRRAVPP